MLTSCYVQEVDVAWYSEQEARCPRLAWLSSSLSVPVRRTVSSVAVGRVLVSFSFRIYHFCHVPAVLLCHMKVWKRTLHPVFEIAIWFLEQHHTVTPFLSFCVSGSELNLPLPPLLP